MFQIIEMKNYEHVKQCMSCVLRVKFATYSTHLFSRKRQCMSITTINHAELPMLQNYFYLPFNSYKHDTEKHSKAPHG